MLKVGVKAPNFSLPDQSGAVHQLKDYAGRWLLLYFYPKDDTPGCTMEACTIRDIWRDFKKMNAAVLGVSADTVKSHKKFAAKFKLPFPILSDEEKKMIKAYKVWGKKKFMGREYMGIRRTSFLINHKGRVAKIYENVKPAEHAAEVLADIKDGPQ
ncbi:MAG: hypothetical protein HW383_513 [Candidatus Magasanikbacteria bacterium]|nr:hypothetical protein [Candidatus Magasanikbacteria bacterium]